METVMIGCPIRNRAWVLPAYLMSLTQMDYDLSKLEFCFIINDCDDQTPDILEQFALRLPGRVSLIINNQPHPGGHLRGWYSFARLAYLRNLLLGEFLKSSCSYLFSVDSDILLPHRALSILLEDRCDVVSALVCNGHEIGDVMIYNLLNRDDSGNYRHLRDFPRNRLFPVDCTGAAYLITREVIAEAGVRYSADRRPEDISFCEKVRQSGRRIFCDSRIEGTHLMRENVVEGQLKTARM